MIDQAFYYVKNAIMYGEHVSDLKKCKEEIQQLKTEVAALRAFQSIVQGAIEVQFKGGNQ